MMHRHRKAFTLIEVLIVVSIIVILIAIILPVVNKSREQARIVGCMTNQRQICVAVRDFCQANNEACPGVCGTVSGIGASATPQYGIGQLISTSDSLPQTTLDKTCRSVLIVRGHLKDSSLFHCPQQDLFGPLQLSVTGSQATFHYVFTDFFVGDTPCVPGGTMTSTTTFLPVYSSRFPNFRSPAGPITFSRAQNPGRCVLITEDGMVQDWTQSYMNSTPFTYVHATPWHIVRSHKSTDRQTFIFADAAVCTYVDGHTELVYVLTRDGINNYCVPSDHTGLPH